MLFLAFAPATVLSPGRALGGGGPENLFLLVNSRSQASMTVANHYVQLRRIPATNILYLDWDPAAEGTDIDTFRQRILLPALEAISLRGLSNQIDYLVYSSDYPTRIDFAGDLPEADRSKSFLSASITSLTYLYQPVLARSPAYMSLTSNNYMPQPGLRTTVPPSHGFRSWYGWAPGGKLLEAGGSRYLLSTMLAVTSGRGNTPAEAISYLTRSASADGTAPKGTIYYMTSSDVRSTTRQPGFATAETELRKLGVAAEVIEGTGPTRKTDVQGAMLGVASLNWADTGSRIRPGAIIDNLTSFGGVLSKGAGQTPLTEFLRAGAAGASGTVVEPYAIPNKFAAPALFVHYARGCSLAESYYQSVWGPYQLLIVGDPLCRPWAHIPVVTLAGIEPGAVVRGDLELRPTARTTAGHAVDRFELFVNGLRLDRCDPGETLHLDTTRVADGRTELRVVGIESNPVETQGELAVEVTIDNRGHALELSASAAQVRDGEPLTLTAKGSGLQTIVVYCQSHPIGIITGSQGTVNVDTSHIGLGPIVFHAAGKAWGSGGRVMAPPLQVEVRSQGSGGKAQ